MRFIAKLSSFNCSLAFDEATFICIDDIDGVYVCV